MLHAMLMPAALYALMLLVPGYLCLRCTRMTRPLALCCAPIVSTSLVGLLGEVYASAHIPATPVSVFAPAVLLPAIALVVLRLRGGEESEDSPVRPTLEWWMPLLFAAVGYYVCNNLFVSELSSLDAIMQRYDVQHHLNMTQAFADARRISSRGVTLYLSEQDAAIIPFSRGSFYPAVWYGQCALLVQATGLSTPAAINVSLAVTMGLLLPLGTCAFASKIFGEDRMPLLYCAATCGAFVMFPWFLLIFGPLYPNLVGFALMGSSLALCMQAFESGMDLRRRALSWALVLFALFGQALMQPNTLFSMFVILVPYVAWRVWETSLDRGLDRMKALLATGGFLALCAAFWVLCYKLPLLQVVIKEYWGAYAYPWQEIINILTQIYTFYYTYVTAQLLLAALVIIGFVRCAYREDRRWLAISYLAAAYILYVSATSNDRAFKRFVCGFWYSDPMRLTATAIIAATPIAAEGLAWIYVQVCHLLKRYNARLKRPTHRGLAALVIGCSFLLLNYMPSFNMPGDNPEFNDYVDQYRIEQHEWDAHLSHTTFGDFRRILREGYDNCTPLDEHEKAFLQEVAGIVGSDLVINDPYDGSALAYGTYGIRVYYRKANGFGSDSETPESLAVRTKLNLIASDDEVRQAVGTIGGRYVITMDSRTSPWSFITTRNDVKDGSYDGISSVTADTPGFTEVLASGACHLYKIDEAEG